MTGSKQKVQHPARLKQTQQSIGTFIFPHLSREWKFNIDPKSCVRSALRTGRRVQCFLCVVIPYRYMSAIDPNACNLAPLGQCKPTYTYDQFSCRRTCALQHRSSVFLSMPENPSAMYQAPDNHFRHFETVAISRVVCTNNKNNTTMNQRKATIIHMYVYVFRKQDMGYMCIQRRSAVYF